jgi:hypothetical protein
MFALLPKADMCAATGDVRFSIAGCGRGEEVGEELSHLGRHRLARGLLQRGFGHEQFDVHGFVDALDQARLNHISIETGNDAGKLIARRFRHALRVGVFERRGPNHQLGADGARHSFESFRASRRQTAPAMLGRNGAKVTEDELGVVIPFEGSEANDFTAPLDDSQRRQSPTTSPSTTSSSGGNGSGRRKPADIRRSSS